MPKQSIKKVDAASKEPPICIICRDPIDGAAIPVPCGHVFDLACITHLFQSSVRDDSLYPPRCCHRNIPFTKVRRYVSQALIADFRLKGREKKTMHRVYCSSPSCNRFLGALHQKSSRKVYDCPAPSCSTRTCGKCRTKYEGVGNHNCVIDAATQQVLDIAQASGWARCPGCSHLIEKIAGCNHMVCRCGTTFDYACK
ncbi:hypothetical protein BDR05DRAFT_989868 [Suillus weaverae]|nr:hypothetical protein BDR05DRAFT_989868 [Suillus weaverae]